LKNPFHGVLEQAAESFLGAMLSLFSAAPIGNVLVHSEAANPSAVHHQRHAENLHFD
jgi:hypothetical protein